MAQLDVSRAIRADLATWIRAGRTAGMSFSVPGDIVVHPVDADAARRVIRNKIATLIEGSDGGLFSVRQLDATTVVLSLS
jgi:hypothetical protein